jgi:DNA helicase-2/ATP-dependent DNA helicase PcrA
MAFKKKIATVAPKKAATKKEVPQVTKTPSRLVVPASRLTIPAPRGFPPSKEQFKIFHEGRDGMSHMIVRATAGSGKTSTAVRMVTEYVPPSVRVLMLVFNVHNAKDLRTKLARAGNHNVVASTFNSFGWSCYKKTHPNAFVSENKLDNIISDLVPEGRFQFVIGPLTRVIRLMKAHGMTGKRDDIQDLLDVYDLDLSEYSISNIQQYAPQVLRKSMEMHEVIDYDDQLWATVVRDLPIDQFDMVVADESQDSSKIQHKLLLRAAGEKGRIVLVGDPRQAIYGWRGADPESMATMVSRLEKSPRGVKELPLSISWRCPRSHVALARRIEPNIYAAPDAPLGVTLELSRDEALNRMIPGDLCISRVNAPLLGYCYALLKRGVPATVRGRQIGNGLASTIRRLRPYSIEDLMKKIGEYEEKEGAKLRALGRNGANRLINFMDKIQCLTELTLDMKTVDEVLKKIESLFSDFDEEGKPISKVVFSTIHRGKGLEANNVYVLSPEVMPHPMAKTESEKKQELNLLFVAMTRGKYERSDPKKFPGTLVWVGSKPAILDSEGEITLEHPFFSTARAKFPTTSWEPIPDEDDEDDEQLLAPKSLGLEEEYLLQ